MQNRVVVINDVPADEIDETIESFDAGPTIVSKTQQPNGLWTIEVTVSDWTDAEESSAEESESGGSRDHD